MTHCPHTLSKTDDQVQPVRSWSSGQRRPRGRPATPADRTRYRPGGRRAVLRDGGGRHPYRTRRRTGTDTWGALELALLGTRAGLPGTAPRAGISTALVLDAATYVIDCGRAAVTRYSRSRPSGHGRAMAAR
ncbi:hypothetical protein GCM10023257_03680 [Streptomyces hyderabadensis]|uniref:Uncharacterized protein n=1 Tax=Streptomyces hyderabadensis TaxID=598549 RepID=A0ABP9HI31_9ACTN